MKRLNYLLPLLLLLLLTRPASAQGDAPITATVDRTSISTGDTVVLTVVVRGDSNARPDLPALTGFEVVGSSSASQISIVNGSMSSQATYQYRLQATQTGDLMIGAMRVTVDGRSYSTDPITIHVTQGSNSAPSTNQPVTPAPAPNELSGQDYFVEAEVDNPNPYQGQQITYTFRFYQAANFLGQPNYDAPDFTGFWHNQQPEQSSYSMQAANRLYDVVELQTILFPTVAGDLTIDPATLDIPGGFFSRGATLQTRPIDLTVQALPADAPADFQGAVGQFTLTAVPDNTSSKVNEPLTWHVTLEGTGNLDTLADIQWPDMPGWRSFDSQAVTNSRVQDGQLSGSRVYDRLLVPTTSGDLALPGLSYSYFDPETGEYHTLTTDPVTISVAPGSAEAPIPNVPFAPDQESVTQLATDIRHIKPVPADLAVAEPGLAQRPLYWLAYLLTPLLLLGQYIWQRRKAYWQNNSDQVRSQQARKKARQILAQARQGTADPYSAAGQVLITYLGDKLNQPVMGLTRTGVMELLKAQGINGTLLEQVQACLLASEMGRYAPNGDGRHQAEDLLRQTEQVVDELEKVIGKQ